MAVVKDATKADILEMARSLPRHELSELRDELSDLLDPPLGPPMTEAEFRAELDRRWEEHLADPSKARPVEEVMAEIRRKYQRHG
jgi:putative addiction module component (TIGR02574 family)